jgi:hypothetical protein
LVTAEIVIDGRRPACYGNIELHGLGDAVGVGQRTRPPIPGFVDRVDAERDAVGEQRIAAVRIERAECVPKLGGLARQVLGPAPMPFVDGFGNCAVVQTGRLATEDNALHVEVEARFRRVAVEQLQAERMQRRQERDIRILSQRIAQTKRAIRGELGHQPIGDRLDALLLLVLTLL